MKFFAAIHRFLKSCDGERIASLSMRWARPIFFILTTTMLLIGWWYPDHIGLYFDAMAKAPEWVTNILTILILGLAVEKGVARPIKEVFEMVKGKAD